jgi:hypothetical protein
VAGGTWAPGGTCAVAAPGVGNAGNAGKAGTAGFALVSIGVPGVTSLTARVGNGEAASGVTGCPGLATVGTGPIKPAAGVVGTAGVAGASATLGAAIPAPPNTTTPPLLVGGWPILGARTPGGLVACAKVRSSDCRRASRLVAGEAAGVAGAGAGVGWAHNPVTSDTKMSNGWIVFTDNPGFMVR